VQVLHVDGFLHGSQSQHVTAITGLSSSDITTSTVTTDTSRTADRARRITSAVAYLLNDDVMTTNMTSVANSNHDDVISVNRKRKELLRLIH